MINSVNFNNPSFKGAISIEKSFVKALDSYSERELMTLNEVMTFLKNDGKKLVDKIPAKDVIFIGARETSTGENKISLVHNRLFVSPASFEPKKRDISNFKQIFADMITGIRREYKNNSSEKLIKEEILRKIKDFNK
mgnify:CR=1 FL=1